MKRNINEMKMNKLLVVIIITLATSMTLQAKKLDLRYNFKKGMEFNYEFVVTQDVMQELMGQSQTTNSEIKQNVSYEVLDVDSQGNYKILFSINSINMKATSPMGDLEFNSDDIPEGDGVWNILKSIIDEKITFIMTDKGKIVEVESADLLVKKYKDMMSQAGPELQMIAGLASKFSSEDAIKESIGSIFIAYPLKKIKIGKSWETVTHSKQLINFKNTNVQTVTRASGESITLAIQVKIEQDEDGGSMEVQGMEMQYELSGGKDGSYDLDPVNGLTVKAESKSSVSGMISIDSPQLPAPMTIPMTVKSIEKITLMK